MNVQNTLIVRTNGFQEGGVERQLWCTIRSEGDSDGCAEPRKRTGFYAYEVVVGLYRIIGSDLLQCSSSRRERRVHRSRIGIVHTFLSDVDHDVACAIPNERIGKQHLQSVKRQKRIQYNG